MKLNKEISNYFLSDANDYLKRYYLLRENATHIGLRAKLLIELLFSLECSLKALIFLESQSDERTTYKKIFTHSLTCLFDLLSEASQNEYTRLVSTDLNNFTVGVRYQLESEISFRTENGVLDKKYYDTIANVNWLNEKATQIKNLIDYIHSLNPVKMDVIAFSEINPVVEIERHKTIVNLRQR